jgi:hypothetical protein
MNLLVLLPGAVLVYSGLLHAWQPFYFAHGVAAYGVLPEPLIALVVFAVPYLQIMIGACLISDHHRRAAGYLAVSLFVCFAALQGKVLFNGDAISCGCFGYFSEPVSWKTLGFSTILLASVASWLFWTPTSHTGSNPAHPRRLGAGQDPDLTVASG